MTSTSSRPFDKLGEPVDVEKIAYIRRRKLIFVIFLWVLLLYFVNSWVRGIIPATLQSLQADLDMTDAESGLLRTFFTVGLMFFLPIYATLGTKYPSQTFRILGLGMLLWLAATIVSAGAEKFWHLAVCRVVSGAGEAAFQVLILPWVDANAPRRYRAFWITLFIGVFALGSAAGTVFAGQLAETQWGWRAAFMLVAAVEAPLILISFCVPSTAPKEELERIAIELDPEDLEDEMNAPAARNSFHSAKNSLSEVFKSKAQAWPVLSDPLVIMACGGYGAAQAVLIGTTFWIILYSVRNLGITQAEAASAVGVLSVVSSFAGVITGGRVLDSVGRRLGGKSVPLAFTIGVIGLIVSLPFLFGMWLSSTPILFFTMFFFALFFLLAGGSVFTPGVLWLVKPANRPFAAAMATFLLNLLGAVPAPLAVGALVDRFGTPDNPFPPMIMVGLTCWLGWTLILWTLVAIISKRLRIGLGVDDEARIGARKKMISDQKEDQSYGTVER